MNKQYNELKEKIISAVPDIMELKRGCYVKDFLKGTLMILAKYTFYENESPVYDFVFFEKDEVSVMRTPRGNWKIIGRPITLFDALIAVKKNCGSLAISELGEFLVFNNSDKEWQGTCIDCELNKPLQDQPEETKQLLYNLICKK